VYPLLKEESMKAIVTGKDLLLFRKILLLVCWLIISSAAFCVVNCFQLLLPSKSETTVA
jgi:cell division protein FtsL